VSRLLQIPGCFERWGRSLRRHDHAAQLVEFAVALPLLVLFVVGIFDFSSAFTLKLKLTNLARNAARVAAAGPISDVRPGSTPVSVMDAFYVVDNYLQANNINDCSVSSTPTGAVVVKWTFTGTGSGCPAAGLQIVVNRGYYFPATAATIPAISCESLSPSGATAVIATCVSIQYPYPWKFGRAASLLGNNASLPTQISTVAIALNEN
jgi:Flp pilus assembly protein TadG